MGALLEPEDVAGFTYVEDQTFGVEVELTSPLGTPDETGLVYGNWKWQLVATVIIDTIERAATLPVDGRARNYHQVTDTSQWRVEFDRSAGWEVVSPTLRNREGFAELVRVLSALHELVQCSDTLRLNHRTGLHITLGSRFEDDLQVQGLVRLTQLLEPGLFTLLCPSRLFHFHDGRYDLSRPNKYCRPLRELLIDPAEMERKGFKGPDPSIRYRTVNLCNVARQDPYIEIRLHHGTTSYSDVIAWLCLWMAVLRQARIRSPDEGSRAAVFPGADVPIDPAQACAEDLFAQLDLLHVQLEPALRRTLQRGRDRLIPNWKAVLPRRVSSWLASWPHEAGRSDESMPVAKGSGGTSLRRKRWWFL